RLAGPGVRRGVLAVEVLDAVQEVRPSLRRVRLRDVRLAAGAADHAARPAAPALAGRLPGVRQGPAGAGGAEGHGGGVRGGAGRGGARDPATARRRTLPALPGGGRDGAAI